MIFKYINMPKLVAFYLREFSLNKNDETSNIYKFVFCLCLPFVSPTFRRARLNALAVAECTNSIDQITKVFEKILDVKVYFESLDTQCMMSFNGVGNPSVFPYNNSLNQDSPIVQYSFLLNNVIMSVKLNGSTTKEEVLSYVPLLIPFYINTEIQFV